MPPGEICLFSAPENPEDIGSDTSEEDGSFNPLLHFRETGRDYTWHQLCQPVAVWLTRKATELGDPREYSADEVTKEQAEEFYFTVWDPDWH